jgi:hypothetical protein
LTNNDENIPLQPLNDVIIKFERRKKIMDWLMLLAMPSAVVGIGAFLLFALVLRFSTLDLVIFCFLVFSSVVSYIAILYIPDALDGVIRSLEFTMKEIAFSITPPIGETPEQRILNQLTRTDRYVKRLIRKNPNAPQLNAQVKGRSGKEHEFEVYIHNVDSIGRFNGNKTDVNIFAKRFDEADPVSEAAVRNVRAAVQDSLSGVGRRFPTRVLVVSASGFEDQVFEYVRSKEGRFFSRYFPRATRRIELIREKVDGSYDVLSF